MTGWRIGYAVGEPEIIAAMSKIAGQRLLTRQQRLNMQLSKL